MKHFLVLFFALAFVIPFNVSADPLPDFVGRHLSEIMVKPETTNYSFKIKKVDSKERRGNILFQIPDAGLEMGNSRNVYLEVSDGLVVPEVLGLTQAEAENKLTALGIGTEATQTRHPNIRKGLVAVQIPSAGTKIDAKRKIVFLSISNDSRVTVPTIKTVPTLKRDIKKLKEEFRSSGLDLKIESKFRSLGPAILPYHCVGGIPHFTERAHKYKVWQTKPAPGALVEPGSQILLIITIFEETMPRVSCKGTWGFIYKRVP